MLDVSSVHSIKDILIIRESKHETTIDLRESTKTLNYKRVDDTRTLFDHFVSFVCSKSINVVLSSL